MNIILGQISSVASEPEKFVGVLAGLVILTLAVWRGVRWLLCIRPLPDPWDAAVAEELEKDDARPLCHHCLAIHDATEDFCPECGTPVGQYTNWLPFPYLFSVGHVLRIGTSGEFKRTSLTIAGFMLLGLVEYAFFAPIYWIVFLRKLFAPSPRNPAEPPTPASAGARR